MRLDRRLNIVFPIDTDVGTLHVHSTPIDRAVFERYFLVISKTFAAIYQQGLNFVAGPAVASVLLKTIAQDLGEWVGETGVERGLVGEIRRITNVAVPAPDGGWTTMPLQDAIDRKVLDDDDAREVEGALTFFMCASAMHRRKDLPEVLGGMAQLWDARLESSNFTEFVASLRTSTGTSTSAPPAASSVPS